MGIAAQITNSRIISGFIVTAFDASDQAGA
jgi:hypothetical protein